MRSAHVGRRKEPVIDPVSEPMQVTQHLVEPESQVPGYVFQYHDRRAQRADRIDEVRPEMPSVVLAFASPCHRERLARVPARENIHRLHGRPVDFRNVAQVGYVRPVMREDFRRRGIELRHPRPLHAIPERRESLFDAKS